MTFCGNINILLYYCNILTIRGKWNMSEIYYGARLRKLINDKGHSTSTLSRKIGVSQSNISQLMNKQYPSLQKIEIICDALKLPIEKFFTNTDIDVFGFAALEERYGITETQIKFLQKFNTLEEKKQKAFLHAFIEIVDKAS